MNLLIVQARLSSTRLPGKVQLPILDMPMLLRQLERLKLCQIVNTLVVATSINPEDDVIASLCDQQAICCFRGDLDDVLSRFYFCAKKFNAEQIIRISGDCPLIDPNLVDQIISHHLESKVDYTTNCIERTFPDGQDIEVFTFNALEQAFLQAKKPSQREHVTPYIRETGLFSTSNFLAKQDWSQYRMSVDHQVDFDLVSKVYESLYQHNPSFTLQDIIEFLNANPSVYKLNQHISLNEGYTQSLALDKSLGYE